MIQNSLSRIYSYSVLGIGLILFVLSVLVMNDSTKALITAKTPRGIIDIQLSWHATTVKFIHDTWQKTKWKETYSNNKSGTEKDTRTALDALQKNLLWDNILFIPAYVILLLSIINLIHRSSNYPTNSTKSNFIQNWSKGVIWTGFLVVVVLFFKPQHLAEWLILLIIFLLGFVVIIRELSFKSMLWIGISAGLFDYIENFLTYQALLNNNFLIPIALPAVGKMGLLAFVIGYLLIKGWNKIRSILINLSFFFVEIFTMLWVNRVIALTLISIFLMLWVADQGQDVLVNLNSVYVAEPDENNSLAWIPFKIRSEIGSNLGPFLFYFVISVLALLHWFLPKYFYNRSAWTINFTSLFSTDWDYKRSITWRYKIKQDKKDKTLGDDDRRLLYQIFVARMLGVLTFIIPACAILHALDIFEIGYGLKTYLHLMAPAILILSIICYGLLLYPFYGSDNALEKAYRWLRRNGFGWCIGVVTFIFILTIIVFGIYNTGHPAFLAFLAIGLYMVSFLFAIWVSVRLIIRKTRRFIKLWTWLSRLNWNKIIIGLGSVTALIFIIYNFFPFLYYEERIMRPITLPIVLTGLVFYVLFFSFLILWGSKWKINFAGFFIAWMLFAAIAFDNDFHNVQLIDKPSVNDSIDAVPTLDDYIKKWLEDRRGEIKRYSNKGFDYPVVLVNTHGGGIRAAAWTSMVIAHLDSLIELKHDSILKGKDNFQNHVLAYSGASGGTIGASVLCAFRKKYAQGKRPDNVNFYVNFYQKDFLTPILIGLFGRDVFFSTFIVDHVDDRGKLQTQLWEKHLSGYIDTIYSQEYTSLWRGDRGFRTDIPLLFSNTYHLEEGRKGIIAPVNLNNTIGSFKKDFPYVLLVREGLLYNTLDTSISFSTGAFLSARFPYISPAGKVSPQHHFMDGGYLENSGAETLYGINTALERVIHALKMDTLWKEDVECIKVICLSLENGVSADTIREDKNVFELLAPFQGLFRVRSGNTEKAEFINRQRFDTHYYKIRPGINRIQLKNEKGFLPVLPLGWQMSFPALERMRGSINEDKNKEITRLIEDFYPRR